MAHIVFYEKPGCAGNARQKGLLVAAGHTLDVRNLLATKWTPASLRRFFGQQPVAEWFNPRAPEVRDRKIDPTSFDEAGALATLIASPILIRRPLMQVDEDCRAGFDPAEIAAWIGLAPNDAASSRQEIEACPKGPEAPPCPPLRR